LGSRTLDELEMASFALSAENQGLVDTKRDDLKSATQYAGQDAYNRAASNIASLPFKDKDESAPLINMGLGIANAAIKGYGTA